MAVTICKYKDICCITSVTYSTVQVWTLSTSQIGITTMKLAISRANMQCANKGRLSYLFPLCKLKKPNNKTKKNSCPLISLSHSKLKYSLTAETAGKNWREKVKAASIRLQAPTINYHPQCVFWELVKNVLKRQKNILQVPPYKDDLPS